MTAARGPVPFITQREGEDAAPDNLVVLRDASGVLRLHYADEDPARDRDMRGVLVARCAFAPVDGRGRPTGRPQWRMMHPHRQIMTMQNMCCQVCAGPARTRLGYVFLSGPGDQDPGAPRVLTNQPPVCPKCVRAAALLCPHLGGNPMVWVVPSAPLYGVQGTLYRPEAGRVRPVDRPSAPVPYGHPVLSTFLASQVVRRLRAFRVVGLE
ncbi:hypothetical protein [Streptomyces sp. AD55]|uniref:hypothetical protein n=1 Tax=Streptomyces sp. AD55 TaxID=3242895 RepID=UPI0035299169